MSWWTSDNRDDEHELDESDVRVRPSSRGSRPRSKRRPPHAEAVPGRVVGVDRGRYSVVVDNNTSTERYVIATKARELTKNSVVTGDNVFLVGDVSGIPGSLSRIVRIAKRSTLLRRSADDSDAIERVIVANADQLLMVVAAADPEPRPALVDRYLVAAFDAGIDPVLCITKTDLRDPSIFVSQFSCFDLPIITSSPTHVPTRKLTELLIGRTTIVVGHSGVGKSTLVNALVPHADRATGHVNAVTGRGRHTSSSTVSLRVTDDDEGTGWVIDTPGVRSFGLGHVNPSNVVKSFANHAVTDSNSEMSDKIALSAANDEEIIDRVEAGELGEVGRERLHSFQRLLRNLGK